MLEGDSESPAQFSIGFLDFRLPGVAKPKIDSAFFDQVLFRDSEILTVCLVPIFILISRFARLARPADIVRPNLLGRFQNL